MVQSFTSVTVNTYIVSVMSSTQQQLCGNTKTVKVVPRGFFISFNFSFQSSAAFSFSITFTRLTKGVLQIEPRLQGVCKKMSKYHLPAGSVQSRLCRHSVSSWDSTVPWLNLFSSCSRNRRKLPLTVSKYKPIAFHFGRRRWGQLKRGLCKWSMVCRMQGEKWLCHRGASPRASKGLDYWDVVQRGLRLRPPLEGRLFSRTCLLDMEI